MILLILLYLVLYHLSKELCVKSVALSSEALLERLWTLSRALHFRNMGFFSKTEVFNTEKNSLSSRYVPEGFIS